MDLSFLELHELFTEWTAVWTVELGMLCALMIAGLYVTYTDLRFRDIPPVAVWGLLGVGLLGQAAMWALGHTNPAHIALVAGGGLAIGYVFYLYGLWAPGDAKLFWAALVALPPTLAPSWPLLSLRAAPWALLINSLVPHFLLLVAAVAWPRRRAGDGSTAEPGLGARAPVTAAGLLCGGLAGLVLGGGLLVLGRGLAFPSAAIGVLVGYLAVERLVPTAHWPLVYLPGLAVGIYAAAAPDSLLPALTLCAVTWAVVVAAGLIKARFTSALVQWLPVEALQEGMVPAVAVCAAPASQSPFGSFICAASVSARRYALCRPGQALTAEQVDRLRDAAARGSLEGFGSRLAVETPLPFAPFLVLGGVVTVLLSGHLGLPLVPLLRAVFG
ncbi:MAG: hypothetical protein AB1505_28760 [Candidatus Latescibacterota bacterium]